MPHPADQPLLVLRTDANTAIGSGHVMRCLSLAFAWQAAGGRCAVVAEREGNALNPLIEQQGHAAFTQDAEAGSSADAEMLAGLCTSEDASCCVVDGYQFSGSFQTNLCRLFQPVLWIDDYAHAAPYAAAYVLNQNVYATEADYRPRSEHTELFLGTRYALLRPAFAEARQSLSRQNSPPHRWLVTLGGSDPGNAAGIIAGALAQTEAQNLSVRFIVGALYQHEAALRATLAGTCHDICVLRGVANMHEHMAWAEAGIIAGGTTAWEACCMGLPSIVLVLAENQARIAAALDASGAACSLGDVHSAGAIDIARSIDNFCSESTLVNEMSRRAALLVDGHGARRVAQALMRHCLHADKARCE